VAGAGAGAGDRAPLAKVAGLEEALAEHAPRADVDLPERGADACALDEAARQVLEALRERAGVVRVLLHHAVPQLPVERRRGAARRAPRRLQLKQLHRCARAVRRRMPPPLEAAGGLHLCRRPISLPPARQSPRAWLGVGCL
jgi:hypothetical protein